VGITPSRDHTTSCLIHVTLVNHWSLSIRYVSSLQVPFGLYAFWLISSG